MSQHTQYVANSQVVDCDIGGDRALLHVDHNTYFTINPTAAAVWCALTEPRDIEFLINLVADEFDVTAEQCKADIQVLLSGMVEAQLVTPCQLVDPA